MWCSMVRSAAQWGWGLGLAGGEERGEDAVVDFRVEDREGESIGGEVVSIGARAAGDDPVAAQPGEVVGGLRHRVGGAEQSGRAGSCW